MDRFALRRERLLRDMATLPLPALLVSRPPHVSYLTGFTGDSSFLLVTPGRTIIISDARFAVQIVLECPGLDASIRGPHRDTWQEAADVLAKLGLTEVAVEATHLTLAQFDLLKDLAPAVGWIPIRGIVESLREVKDESEVAALRRAVAQTEEGLRRLTAVWKPEHTEKELADLLDHLMRNAGAREAAFPIQVSVDERSALPHGTPGGRRLGESRFVLIDWGACEGLYRADLTRVMPSPYRERNPATRDVESRLEKLYTVVSRSQAAAAALLRPGVSAREVDAAARGVIEAAGMGEAFNHGLGHGLGLEVHEAPSIRRNSDDVLRAGQVVTLEPGVYFPDFGGVRIEDDFLITADGAERLSSRSAEHGR